MTDSSRKQLILHIGRPKVGSTTLQHFLWKNREELLKRGLLYPTSAMLQRASHKLALVFQPDYQDAKALAGQSAESIYAQVLWEAQIAEAATVIASSENLFLVSPDLVHHHLEEKFDTKVVCYVRRQDEVLVSSFLQELKTGSISIDTDIEEYAANPERLAWLDYDRVLAQWAAAFGDDNIIVRVFEPQQMNGSICSDFISLTGCSSEGLVFPEGRINPSPARDVLDFIRIINETPELPSKFKPLLRAPLLNLSERIGSAGAFDAKALIPASVRRYILKYFQASNAKVAERFLGRSDGVLFQNSSVAEPGIEASYAGLDLTRFAQMTATLFSVQQQRINQLQNQIRELQQQMAKLGTPSNGDASS